MPIERQPRSLMSATASIEFIAAAGGATLAAGHRLGLYQAMDRLGHVTPLQLAIAAGAAVWFVDGWLQAQTRAGYATFDPQTERYALFCRIQPVNS